LSKYKLTAQPAVNEKSPKTKESTPVSNGSAGLTTEEIEKNKEKMLKRLAGKSQKPARYKINNRHFTIM